MTWVNEIIKQSTHYSYCFNRSIFRNGRERWYRGRARRARVSRRGGTSNLLKLLKSIAWIFKQQRRFTHLPFMFISSEVIHKRTLILEPCRARMTEGRNTFANNLTLLISYNELWGVIFTRRVQRVSTDRENVFGALIIVPALIFLVAELATEGTSERHRGQR